MIAAARAALRRLSLLALVALACASTALALMLVFRYGQISRGEGAVSAPALAYGDVAPRTGGFTATLALTSPAVSGDVNLSVPVSWDDAWFFSDPAAYNHELATTSSVLAALAYSESGYYQAGRTSPAYMEGALGELGFDAISTSSYRYRSEVLDQILNVITRQDGTGAYTIARKDVEPSSSGERARSVILVSVRGSYGAEWLSNLEFSAEPDPSTDVGAPSDEASGPQAVTADSDHAGYARAAREILGELAPWVQDAHDEGRDVSLLLVGHSRGGAIANLMAAMADDELASRRDGGPASAFALDAADDVHAYTFASPNTTTSAHAAASRYANIFNIVNPSDIMPCLPLSEWGYRRYGADLLLPAVDDEGFEERHEAMRARLSSIARVEIAYDPYDARTIAALVTDAGARVRSARDLMTPTGIASVIASCAGSVDPARLLCGHYPCAYIAWMQAIDAEGFVRSASPSGDPGP